MTDKEYAQVRSNIEQAMTDGLMTLDEYYQALNDLDDKAEEIAKTSYLPSEPPPRNAQ